jgi:hypothetical protein
VTAKFQVEYFNTIKNQVYVLCKRLTEEVNCYLSDHSYLGDFPIENWIDMPLALDEDSKQRMDLFAFVLKNAHDKEKIKVNDIYEMWDDYVDVIASFKLSNEKMITLLKCYPGKYEEEYLLEDPAKRQWILKKYLVVTGSAESYEKTRKEESENVFQYLIQPVGHEEKPEIGARLRIYRKQ